MLVKTCAHLLQASLQCQMIVCIHSAGFPCSVLLSAYKAVIQKLKDEKEPEPLFRMNGPGVILCMHIVAHNWKNVANGDNDPVVFSMFHKLAKLCPHIPGPPKKPPSGKKHVRSMLYVLLT